MQNQSHGDRLVRVTMSSTSVFYTGERAHLVKKGEGEFVLRPNESASSNTYTRRFPLRKFDFRNLKESISPYR